MEWARRPRRPTPGVFVAAGRGGGPGAVKLACRTADRGYRSPTAMTAMRATIAILGLATVVAGSYLLLLTSGPLLRFHDWPDDRIGTGGTDSAVELPPISLHDQAGRPRVARDPARRAVRRAPLPSPRAAATAAVPHPAATAAVPHAAAARRRTGTGGLRSRSSRAVSRTGGALGPPGKPAGGAAAIQSSATGASPARSIDQAGAIRADASSHSFRRSHRTTRRAAARRPRQRGKSVSPRR